MTGLSVAIYTNLTLTVLRALRWIYTTPGLSVPKALDRRANGLRRRPSSAGPPPAAHPPETGMTSPIQRSMQHSTRRSQPVRSQARNDKKSSAAVNIHIASSRADLGSTPHISANNTGTLDPKECSSASDDSVWPPDPPPLSIRRSGSNLSWARGSTPGVLPRTGARRQYRNQGARSLTWVV